MCDWFNQQVPYTDLHEASECLVKALLIRQRYMSMSGQSFPSVMTRFLQHTAASQFDAGSDVRCDILPAGENGDNSSLDSGWLFYCLCLNLCEKVTSVM